MAVAKLQCVSVLGVDVVPIHVEIDVSWGIPSFAIVGLADAAVREARDRVRSAIRNSGLEFPDDKITINLAPADVKKVGSAFDLAIAVGLLVASGEIPASACEQATFVGELGLDGCIKPVRGALAIAAHMRQQSDSNNAQLVLPEANLKEARWIEGVQHCGYETLSDLVADLHHGQPVASPITPPSAAKLKPSEIDFADVAGQESTKRALEIAAAGRHNMLMIGPPGSGKTMLARRLPTIMPQLEFDEALESTKIHSVAGYLPEGGLLHECPFRAPHHSISDAGLIGGGTIPRPGEVSLAHNGVLFLDEMAEFRKHVLEVLRQPLEDREVTISRSALALTFPARFMLIAAMNPSATGDYDASRHQRMQYQSKISGPLMDRIDLQVHVPAVDADTLSDERRGEPSAMIKQRVSRARKIQSSRFGNSGMCNADMNAPQIEEFCPLCDSGQALLSRATETLGLSARGYARVRKLARTIADLAGEPQIQPHHVAEAIGYRTL